MLQLRGNLTISYNDVLTRDVLAALNALAPLDVDRRQLMQSRLDRRAERQRRHERINFLDPHTVIGRTSIRVQDARDGKFAGDRARIPAGQDRRPDQPAEGVDTRRRRIIQQAGAVGHDRRCRPDRHRHRYLQPRAKPIAE